MNMNLNGIDYLGLERVLKRGSGEILADREQALLVRDRVSGAYLLACEDREDGLALLDRYAQDCRLLMIADHAVGLAAFARYGFSFGCGNNGREQFAGRTARIIRREIEHCSGIPI